MSEVYFKKDEVWDSFLGTETAEHFKKNLLHTFRFKNEVPDSIVKSFEIVEKLLIHSYTEYDFLDPALTKALSSFEMALKIRFEEITKGKWKGNLQALSAWFNSRGYFEYDCAGLLEAIRSTRNKQSHPENHFGGGVGLMGVFRHCNNLINDLYEDKEKRRHRREEKSKVKSLLDFLRNNGAVASLLGTRYIIYDAGIFFINNKGAERKYYGFFKKIFELPAENGLKKDNAPILFFFEADEWATEHNGQLIFSNGKSCFLTIDPIFSLLEAKEFKSWKSRYNNSDIYWQTDMAVTDQIDKQWLKEKNAFHFQEDFTL